MRISIAKTDAAFGRRVRNLASAAALSLVILLVCVRPGTAADTTPPTGAVNASPTSVTTGRTINIAMTGSDNIDVASLYVHYGGSWHTYDCTGVQTSCAYTFTTSESAAGVYDYTAYVVDAAGNYAYTPTSNKVTVTAPDTTLPTVSLTAPANGATVSGAVDVAANASDNVGVAKVEFYVDGALKTADTTSPYSYSWNTTAASNGSHTILARAYDGAGNLGTHSISASVNNGQRTGMLVPVLELKYFPLSGGNLDPNITGLNYTLDFARSQVQNTSGQLIQSLNQGSAYLKDPDGTPSLDYIIYEAKEFLYAVPQSATFNNRAEPKTPFPDYFAIFSPGNIDICDYVDNKGIREVWIWMYHTNTVMEPPESNMAMGTNSSAYWNHAGYGDVSNSWQDKDMPVCQHTYTVYDYNYSRGVDCAIEDHAHQLERLFNFADYDLFWKKFVEPYGNLSGTPKHCGWTHFPPNGAKDYDWRNTTVVQSNCSDWRPDGSGAVENVSCSNWTCGDDGGTSFKVWWMKRLPGRNNGLMLNGKTLRNWWDWKGDFDAALALGKNLFLSSNADTTLPAVSLTAPANGVTVSGTVNVTANASDNVGVAKVEFYVDGTLKATDTAGPYSYSWNTSSVSNGSHTLMARAYDGAGNLGTHSISVTVSNGPADLDVLFIERSPMYNSLHGHIIYTSGYPEINPAAYATTKRQPDPGETVTFTANIMNTGISCNNPIPYQWKVDGNVVANGSFPGLAGGATVQAALNWTWQAGDHILEFAADPADAIPELNETNNTVTEYTNALSLYFQIEQAAFNYFKTLKNQRGSTGFHDWVRIQLEELGARYKRAAVNGVFEKLRVGKVQIFNDNTLPCGGMHANQSDNYDGVWGWQLQGVSSCAEGAYSQAFLSSIAGGVEEALLHELGHQNGLIDNYNMDVAANNVQVPDPAGNPVSGTAYLPKAEWCKANPDCPVYYNQAKPSLMSDGSGELHRFDAVGLYSNLGKRRGYYGDYLYDLPQTVKLKIVDADNQPVPGATLSFYQRQTNGTIPNTVVFQGTTDNQGAYTLPNRAAASVLTYTNHQLRPNPFGQVSVVGGTGVLLFRADYGSQFRYFWLDLTELVVAYHQGGRNEAAFTRTFTGLTVDNTAPVLSSVTASAVTHNSATIGWTTNEAADTQVEYGLTTGYGISTALNTTKVVSHAQLLSGLERTTLYHYRVKSRDAAGNLGVSGDYTFTSSAAGPIDLDVAYISRLPRYNYDAAKGWPAPGDIVTFTAHIINKGNSNSGDFRFSWSIDGNPVQSGVHGTLSPGVEAQKQLSWTWQSGNHSVKFEADPGNVIAEISEVNNFIEDRTNALAAGFWVEQSLYNWFNLHQNKLGTGSNSWEDWAQKQIAAWNQIFQDSNYLSQPQGVSDRVRLDKIVIVPDGALPLGGGSYPTNMPDLRDKSVDLMWGFPNNSQNNGFYGTSGIPKLDLADSNPFYKEYSLMHELSHARYLIDLYAFNLNPALAMDDVKVLKLDSSKLLPAGTKKFYECEGGMMSCVAPAGRERLYSEGDVFALNRIAGKRAKCGNYNAPCNLGEYMSDLPADNVIKALNASGNPLSGAEVKVYQSVQDPFEDLDFYDKLIDAVPDKQGVTDINGEFSLGSNPFSGVSAYDGSLAVIQILKAGKEFYYWLYIPQVNLAYWKGNTVKAVYTVQTNISVNDTTPPAVSLTCGQPAGGKMPVTLAASDPESYVAAYRISASASFADTAWQPASNKAAFTLDLPSWPVSLNADTQLYAQVRNGYGDDTAVSCSQSSVVSSISPDIASVIPATLQNRSVIVRIPPKSFRSPVTVTIKTPRLLPSAADFSDRLKSTGISMEIKLDTTTQPAEYATIEIFYADSDVAGLNKSDLLFARYDEAGRTWVPLESVSYPERNKVTGKTRHFSLFQVMLLRPLSALSQARIYPNPFHPGSASGVKFDGLPAGTSVKLYTPQGELVWKGTANSSGSAEWPGVNRSGRLVASGLYLVYLETGGSKKTMKLSVEK